MICVAMEKKGRGSITKEEGGIGDRGKKKLKKTNHCGLFIIFCLS